MACFFWNEITDTYNILFTSLHSTRWPRDKILRRVFTPLKKKREIKLEIISLHIRSIVELI